MTQDIKNLQNIFLNYLRKNKVQVTVFLHNGVKLQGIITWFDNFCLLLRRHDSQQLVYKHSVATVMPRNPIDLRSELNLNIDDSDGEGDGDSDGEGDVSGGDGSGEEGYGYEEREEEW